MSGKKPLYYADYLSLDSILNAQHPVSRTALPNEAHDEMLFIVVHQAFELWFLQALYELDSVLTYLQAPQVDDNSEAITRIVQRLERIVTILRHANGQFDIMETMQPLDFLEFRGLLNPSSGFQSKQFRLLEAKLGLQMSKRHMPEHYKNAGTHHGGFSTEDHEAITKAEKGFTLVHGLKNWLNRMPFFEERFWKDYQRIYPDGDFSNNPFMSDYYHIYQQLQQETLSEVLEHPMISDEVKTKSREGFDTAIESFRNLFIDKGTDVFTAREMSVGLFILLYKDFPMLRLPYALIQALVEIDEQMSAWRYRHYSMVKKVIGTRPGTGGSPGAAYLLGAMQKNQIFQDLTLFTTYFLERDKLPVLPDGLRYYLSFVPYK
jgi:tryptophan 2,3-dioxygenase